MPWAETGCPLRNPWLSAPSRRRMRYHRTLVDRIDDQMKAMHKRLRRKSRVPPLAPEVDAMLCTPRIAVHNESLRRLMEGRQVVTVPTKNAFRQVGATSDHPST